MSNPASAPTESHTNQITVKIETWGRHVYASWEEGPYRFGCVARDTPDGRLDTDALRMSGVTSGGREVALDPEWCWRMMHTLMFAALDVWRDIPADAIRETECREFTFVRRVWDPATPRH